MNQHQQRRRDSGMTLIEMMISMVVFSVIMGSVVTVFRAQNRGMAVGSDRMSVLQNVRFAMETLSSDLRTVGSGVPAGQPFLVYLDEDAVAFNADYATNVANDVFAIFYDPDAPSGSVSALKQGYPVSIPQGTMSYPDTSYTANGINSPAETIMFYFEPDAATSRSDDYVLYRQVNHDAPQVVANRIVKPQGEEFFEFLELSGGSVNDVPSSKIPMRHSVSIHGAPEDVDAAAAIDSVRAIRINLGATNGLEGESERLRFLTRTIRLPNAGMATLRTCGDEPLAVGSLNAAVVDLGGGDLVVRLTWSAAPDDGGGEGDAARYTIWRRVNGAADWGDPFVSIPVGNQNYLYEDAALTDGDMVSYAIAVQDCTPQLSSLKFSPTLLVQ